MVSQEDAPLARLGDGRCALDDLDERLAVLQPQGHEHPRHQGEVERHVELVAVPEIGTHVLRPLVGFGEQRLPREVLVEALAEESEHIVRLRQVLAGRPFPLDQVRHAIHPEPVHTHVQPELHHVPHLFTHRRVVVVEIRLVAEETMPVVRL